MSKVLFVVAPENYQDNEFEVPHDALTAAGHDVDVASLGTGLAKGVLGGSTKVDVDVADVEITEYEAVAFIGGGGAKVYFDNEHAHKIAKEAVQHGAVVAAICVGPSTLANAGVLKGKKATSFPTEQENLTQKGAEFTGTDVEVDGNIVTASGPHAAKAFADEIIRLLA